MSPLLDRSRPLVLSGMGLSAGIALLLACTTPCLANMNPEAAIMIHVQQISDTCDTAVAECFDINRTTTEDGPLEFLIFVWAPYAEGGTGDVGVLLSTLDTELVWPESWEFLGFEPCPYDPGYVRGSLDPTGTTHHLHIEWDRYRVAVGWYLVVAAARIKLDVHGPGRLEFANGSDVPLILWDQVQWHSYDLHAVGISAEAATGCEYTTAPCWFSSSYCAALFHEPGLALQAAPGGIAVGMVGFWNQGPGGSMCDHTIDPRADWASAEIIDTGQWFQQILRVTADASGLVPGVYETDIQLANDEWGARCLPVIFTVETPPTALRRTSWGWIKSVYR